MFVYICCLDNDKLRLCIVRYQTHVAEARDDMWGYCAYSSLVIVKPVTEKDLNGLPDFQLLEVNSTKFTAISFCHAPWAELPIADCVVVSGCEQGYVRLWNLSTSAVEQFHDAHKVYNLLYYMFSG